MFDCLCLGPGDDSSPRPDVVAVTLNHIIDPCCALTPAQSDGNLVLYTAGNQPVWDSKTCGKGAQPFHLDVQADGNLVSIL